MSQVLNLVSCQIPVELVVGLTISIRIVANYTKSLILECIRGLFLSVVITLQSRFTSVTIDVATEVEDTHRISLVAIVCRQLKSISSYEWSISSINSSALIDTVSPVEVVELVLLILTHTLLENQS